MLLLLCWCQTRIVARTILMGGNRRHFWHPKEEEEERGVSSNSRKSWMPVPIPRLGGWNWDPGLCVAVSHTTRNHWGRWHHHHHYYYYYYYYCRQRQKRPI